MSAREAVFRLTPACSATSGELGGCAGSGRLQRERRLQLRDEQGVDAARERMATEALPVATAASAASRSASPRSSAIASAAANESPAPIGLTGATTGAAIEAAVGRGARDAVMARGHALRARPGQRSPRAASSAAADRRRRFHCLVGAAAEHHRRPARFGVTTSGSKGRQALSAARAASTIVSAPAGGAGELHDPPVEVVGSARREASARHHDALPRELIEQRAEQARAIGWRQRRAGLVEHGDARIIFDDDDLRTRSPGRQDLSHIVPFGREMSPEQRADTSGQIGDEARAHAVRPARATDVHGLAAGGRHGAARTLHVAGPEDVQTERPVDSQIDA